MLEKKNEEMMVNVLKTINYLATCYVTAECCKATKSCKPLLLVVLAMPAPKLLTKLNERLKEAVSHENPTL